MTTKKTTTKTPTPAIKLLKNHRDEIASRLISAVDAAKRAEYTKASVEFALKAYNATFTPKERRQLKALAAKEWIASQEYITVGEKNGSYISVQLPKGMSLALPYSKYVHNRIMISDAALIAEMKALNANYRGDYYGAEGFPAKIRQTLSTFKTFEDLIAGWPECAPYAKEVMAAAKKAEAPLPAIPITELNKQLGLPIPTEKKS